MTEPVARLTGHTVTEWRPMPGYLREAVLDDGRVVVVKRGHEPGATAAEAAGLRWLAAAKAVPVPSVAGHDEDWLVVDRVLSGRSSAAAAERLGRGLARLHAAGAPAFGAAPPGGPAEAWIGLAPMGCVPADDWASWYASDRVLPYVRRAVDAGTFDAADAAVFERACDRIPASAEPPARLHGDLWTGNVLWDGREAWLIDPAAHGGHRETDLAMLHLFGCPHLGSVLGAYEEVAPLAEGWAGRIGLHQLFPLLVHTVLFGRSYAGQAVAAARSF
ncbi:fructosamine kinase family protein [Amycolatopsis sp. RTGN1]|uniref:fructosamine kinase family protein n=1 Tax=Amycolatopsis ponsaeliensis TaxID=2992142 RepID=UPI00254C18B8|nr:fructosamine kinase family protein [Amycolatopsis sp. RTGN1]